MNIQDVRAKLKALKTSATKAQKELIDLILAAIKGKAKVTPNKTLDRLLQLKENRPIVYAVLGILCEFLLRVGEHIVITDLLNLFGL